MTEFLQLSVPSATSPRDIGWCLEILVIVLTEVSMPSKKNLGRNIVVDNITSNSKRYLAPDIKST